MLDPALLFFLAGLLAVALRSDLEIPQPIPRLLSLYLLIAIGLKGGIELQQHGLDAGALKFLGLGLGFAILVPFLVFPILKRFVASADAAALAAAYGSVSAVTFAAAQSFLESRSIAPPGIGVVAMVFMEAPAILIGLILYRNAKLKDAHASQRGSADSQFQKPQAKWTKLIHESVTNSSVFLLLTGLVVGLVSNPSGRESLMSVFGMPFKGVLALFLLDMGLISAKRLALLVSRKALPMAVVAFGLIYPLVAGSLANVISTQIFGFGLSESFILSVLVSSASYIAVPAAMRLAVPEAQPGIYLGAALGLTFPTNLFLGLQIHFHVAQLLTGGI